MHESILNQDEVMTAQGHLGYQGLVQNDLANLIR